MSSGFFRGTSQTQTSYFTDKEDKMLREYVWPETFEKSIDFSTISLDMVKCWLAQRITHLTGHEDDILIEFIINNLLNEDNHEIKGADPKTLTVRLTGFLGENAFEFVNSLWTLLLTAQEQIPEELKAAQDKLEQAQRLEAEKIKKELALLEHSNDNPAQDRSLSPEPKRRRHSSELPEDASPSDEEAYRRRRYKHRRRSRSPRRWRRYDYRSHRRSSYSPPDSPRDSLADRRYRDDSADRRRRRDDSSDRRRHRNDSSERRRRRDDSFERRRHRDDSLDRRRRRDDSLERRRHRDESSERRRRRDESPERRRRRDESSERRRHRDESLERRKHPDDSPERRRRRDDSPERRRHREDSAERRRRRDESLERRKHRDDSPERRRRRDESPERNKNPEESAERRRRRDDSPDHRKQGGDYGGKLRGGDYSSEHRKRRADSVEPRRPAGDSVEPRRRRVEESFEEPQAGQERGARVGSDAKAREPRDDEAANIGPTETGEAASSESRAVGAVKESAENEVQKKSADGETAGGCNIYSNGKEGGSDGVDVRQELPRGRLSEGKGPIENAKENDKLTQLDEGTRRERRDDSPRNTDRREAERPEAHAGPEARGGPGARRGPDVKNRGETGASTCRRQQESGLVEAKRERASRVASPADRRTRGEDSPSYRTRSPGVRLRAPSPEERRPRRRDTSPDRYRRDEPGAREFGTENRRRRDPSPVQSRMSPPVRVRRDDTPERLRKDEDPHRPGHASGRPDDGDRRRVDARSPEHYSRHHARRKADRVEPDRAEVNRADPHRAESHRGDSHRGDSHRGDSHRGDSHRADSHRVDSHRADSHRVDSHRAESHRADSHRADSHRAESHRAESHRGESRRAEADRVEGHPDLAGAESGTMERGSKNCTDENRDWSESERRRHRRDEGEPSRGRRDEGEQEEYSMRHNKPASPVKRGCYMDDPKEFGGLYRAQITRLDESKPAEFFIASGSSNAGVVLGARRSSSEERLRSLALQTLKRR